jgi:hypothetical protein
MTGPALALGAAVLFGVSAPAAKLLVGAVDPQASCTSGRASALGSSGSVSARLVGAAVRRA